MSDSGSQAPAPECYRHAGRETWIRCQRCERPICPDCMRDASVGFQCPECVQQGARETRSGRATYGGTRSANPSLTAYVLIALNALVWLAIMATGQRDSDLVNRLALLSSGKCVPDDQPSAYYPLITSEAVCQQGPDGVHWVDGVADGAWWQLMTSTFTHVEVWHIGFNMLALWFLGPALEAAVGRARFLAIYLGSGLTGSVLVYLLADLSASTAGASGSIFGLLAAHLVVGRKVGADLSQLGLWIGLNVLITVLNRDSISWQGHLGGFVGGALLTAVIVHAPRGERRTLVQAIGVAVVVLASVAFVVARTAVLT